MLLHLRRAGRPAPRSSPGHRCDPTSQPWRRCAPCWGRTPPAPGRAWSRSGSTASTSLVAGAFLGAITGTLARVPRACSCSSRPPSACGATSSAPSATGSRRRSTPAPSACRSGARPCSARTCSPRASSPSGISLAARGRGQGGRGRPRPRPDTIDRARPGHRVDRRAACSASVVVLAAVARPDGGRGALRLGPRQRDRAARVDARRRAHAAALWLATFLLGIAVVTPVARRRAGRRRRWRRWSPGWRSSPPALRRIVRESVPVLLVAGVHQRHGRRHAREAASTRFDALPGPAGARARLPVAAPAPSAASCRAGCRRKLLLGLVDADARPEPGGPRATSRFVFLLALPVYAVQRRRRPLVAPGCSARPARGSAQMVAVVAARRRRWRWPSWWPSPTTAPSSPSAPASTPTPTASRSSARRSTSSAPSPSSSPSPLLGIA